jgi:hypothetical protein
MSTDLQALPRLTDREKLTEMLDPVLQGQYQLKELIQVIRKISASISPGFTAEMYLSLSVKRVSMAALFNLPWSSTDGIGEWLQIAAIAAMCVQPEADYRPLMTDVVQSLVPLVKQRAASKVVYTPNFHHQMVILKSSSIDSGSSGNSWNVSATSLSL